MRFTDDDLTFLYHELSAWHEAASTDSERGGVDRIAHLERLIDKVADEQIRREGKRQALPDKSHPSKWDRFRPGSAMDALMQKINSDRQA